MKKFLFIVFLTISISSIGQITFYEENFELLKNKKTIKVVYNDSVDLILKKKAFSGLFKENSIVFINESEYLNDIVDINGAIAVYVKTIYIESVQERHGDNYYYNSYIIPCRTNKVNYSHLVMFSIGSMAAGSWHNCERMKSKSIKQIISIRIYGNRFNCDFDKHPLENNGFLRNNLQLFDEKLSNSKESKDLKLISKEEIKKLKNDTLFIVSNSGTHSDYVTNLMIKAKYPYKYKFITELEIEERVLFGDKAICYLTLARTNNMSRALIKMINSKTGHEIMTITPPFLRPCFLTEKQIKALVKKINK